MTGTAAPSLTAAQRAALAHIGARGRAGLAAAGATLRRLADAHGLPHDRLAAAVDRSRRYARVALHFHPDRLTADGRSVADHLLADGIYRNQFETGISNGSVSAHDGGERDHWERVLFDGAYHAAGVAAPDRPKYGALDLLRHADGPAPRFGSCYLILSPTVLAHATLTFGDSHLGPEHAATADAIDTVLAPLFAAVASKVADYGLPGVTLAGLLDHLDEHLDAVLPNPAVRRPGRLLDDYVEAQVHGPVDLSRDAEVLVVDPSFRGTRTGATLAAAARIHGIRLAWHPGFVLDVAAVSPTFRGPRMPALAARVADGAATIDASVIGRAAASLVRRPEDWADWGGFEQARQQLKQLWHVLVHQGRPAGS